MEKPVEGPRYALVLHKGHNSVMKVAELKFYDEIAGLYVGRYINIGDDPANTGAVLDRDIPENHVMVRWDAMPSLNVIEQTKKTVQQRLFRSRQKNRERSAL